MLRSKIVERVFSHKEDCPTVLLANINTSIDLHKNLAKIEEIIEIAHEKRVNIVIFPELAITGYIWESLEDQEIFHHLRAGESNLVKNCLNNIRNSLVDNGKGLEYVFINNAREKNGSLYNSTYVINSKIDHYEESIIYDKIFLTPLEQRYFKRGSDKRLVIDTKWGRFGFLTCYDLCFMDLAKKYAFIDDVDVIVTIAAWRAQAIRDYSLMNIRTDNYYGYLWDLMNSSKAAHNQVWSLGVNCVGSHEVTGSIFWGKSGIWAPSGLPLLQASNMREELLIIRNIDIKDPINQEWVEFNYRIEFNNIYKPILETNSHIIDFKNN
ncbi:Predicted amidohydrolase [Natronincola peptidivorans]|uniref:Predicted amidohydrolase n=1 Tax=Natronincola peptidivorans TaxID=426128 RepID=A0A1I0GD03_9FIRM|nr:carbon-nitrogen hydrolase family protein [Natronincola peptidivorans]SET68791.1 Predicted amidohydrolase [Natronincola peptidivorans]